MLKNGICLLFLFIALPALAQQDKSATKTEPAIRQYWFVLLTKGPHRDQD